MGEWSHPPCEGWRGNVAGGNGFSQSAETEGGGGSLGATVAHRTVRLPRLCRGDAHCVCLSVWHAAPAGRQRLIKISGLSSRDGWTLTLRLIFLRRDASPAVKWNQRARPGPGDSSQTSAPLPFKQPFILLIGGKQFKNKDKITAAAR